ncbi:glycosyltransferase family 4 protein [Thiocystis violascens]|uniref:Glycosyltransferase n=1 Tax=Thiocystis violascens (strain ATCC 17096 / DSM 198 / 6111) TaxID=765911 RepID=I3YFW9_THIV6|nr:glycosyltransferase family 4 protein [Thiocystis violascens]AFL75887.1 glycosyltransferase [Thiocystis violascens DSM 198]
MSGFRILMFSSYFPPEYSGAALQAVTLAKELRARGHHIEFVTQRWEGLSAEDAFDGFRVTRLDCGRGDKHRELRLWWNLYRFLQRRHRDFDFLHTHGAYYRNVIVGPLGHAFKLKSLAKASLANNDLRDLGQTITGRIHLAMLRRVDACLAISRDLEREFIEGGVSAERVHYFPNCVDTERLFPADPHERQALRHRYGLPLDKKIVLYMGVFDDRKNVGWLIREWLRAEGFGLNALLLAVGPRSREDPHGYFKETMSQDALAHPDLLRIEGEVVQVADYYRAADLFIMPSKSEGLPNAVLEAMACGLPCLAANVSGTRELVVDGQTGCLFEPDDVAGLRAALQCGLGSAAQALGAAGRRRVEECFSIRQLADRYVDLYRFLIRH